MVRTVLLALVTTALVPGCSWGTELPSDPAYWLPADGPSRPDAGGPGGDGGLPEAGPLHDPLCNEEPAHDPGRRTSVATALSHLPGRPCLESCHEEGGSARAVFAAAGTVYRSQTSRAVAAAGGKVHAVGGTTLVLDRCGNFYAVPDALTVSPRLTQPFVQNPTLHKMDKVLSRESKAGDCNSAGCHDFSGRLRWGIYY